MLDCVRDVQVDFLTDGISIDDRRLALADTRDEESGGSRCGENCGFHGFRPLVVISRGDRPAGAGEN